MALRQRRLGQRFTTLARAEALPAGEPAVRWCWAVQDRQVRRRPSSAGSTGTWDTESKAPKYMRRAHFKACYCVTISANFFSYSGHGRGKAAPSDPPISRQAENHGLYDRGLLNALGRLGWAKLGGILPPLSRHKCELPSARVDCTGLVWRLCTLSQVMNQLSSTKNRVAKA